MYKAKPERSRVVTTGTYVHMYIITLNFYLIFVSSASCLFYLNSTAIRKIWKRYQNVINVDKNILMTEFIMKYCFY